MNWRALAGNKRVQLGVGAAAVVGVAGFALYRRHQAGGDVGSQADASSSGTPASYVPGSFPDTSGTDMAGYLGQFGSNLQTQLDDFLSALQDQQAGTGQIPTSGSTGTGTTAPTGPVVKPIVTPPAASGAKPIKGPIRQISVVKFTTKNPAWNSTLSGIAAHEHTTVSALQKLNGIKGTTIYPGQKIKIPG